MYEKIAWDNFYKTGNVESFLEYKRLNRLASFEDFIDNNNDDENNNDDLEKSCE